VVVSPGTSPPKGSTPTSTDPVSEHVSVHAPVTDWPWVKSPEGNPSLAVTSHPDAVTVVSLQVVNSDPV
jgi:hypothetical protein